MPFDGLPPFSRDLIAPAAGGGGNPRAVRFTAASSQYLNFDVNGPLPASADASMLTVALCLKIKAASGTHTLIRTGGGGTWRLQFQINSSRVPTYQLRNTAGTTILACTATAALPLDTWTHILLSVRFDASADFHLYHDHTDVAGTPTTLTNSEEIGWDDETTTGLSADHGGTNLLDAEWAVCYIDPNTYNDFSVASTRYNFFDSSHVPQTLTGVGSPNILLQLPASPSAANDWADNLGSGGTPDPVTILNGPLTFAADDPY